MVYPSTWKQREFLKNLGYSGAAKLSSKQASEMINNLLAVEANSGATNLKCPYCNEPVKVRPKKQKKCGSCGKTMCHSRGKLYTAKDMVLNVEKDQQRDHKEWVKETRKNFLKQIRDDIKDDKETERDLRDMGGLDPEDELVGYEINVGEDCLQASAHDGIFLSLEEIKAKPDRLPPFDGCSEDDCCCDIVPIRRKDAPRGARIHKPKKRVVKDYSTSSSSKSKSKGGGCSGCLIIIIAIIFFAWLFI